MSSKLISITSRAFHAPVDFLRQQAAGEGPDHLPVADGVAVAAQVMGQIAGTLVGREPTRNTSPASSRSFGMNKENADISHEHQIVEIVPGLK